MRRRRSESLAEEAKAGLDAFTVSFTSFSMILLAFFIFIDSISVSDVIRRSGVLDSLGGEFVYGDRPAESANTPEAILAISRAADFEVIKRGDRYVITMPGALLFESGDDAVRPDAQATLKALARTISTQELAVRIEGHTDSVPIYTSRFASNWELSAARAVSVLRLFLNQGVPAERLSAAGRGEFSPVASNDSAEGRARNRRVVLIIRAASASGPADE